jgi:MFS family permease
MKSSQQQEVATTGGLQAFSVFRYREYRLFWLGAVFSNLGIWALMAGRLWLMHDLTSSPLMLGLLAISGTGPILLLSMWGGVVADRVNRLRLITFTRALFSLLALLTGVLVAFEVVRPWHLIAISLATGVLLSFDIPSRQAILGNLVPKQHLLHAIVLYSFIFGGAAIVGPSYFAPLVNLWGLEGLFFFVGVSYALTVAMLVMMKPMQNPTGAATARIWEDLLAGLSYVRRHRTILSLIGMAVAAGLFGASFGTLLPVFADQILKGGVETYSVLLLGIGAGGLAGTALLAFFGNLKESPRLQLIAGVGFGLGLALFSRITYLPVSVAVLVLVAGSSSAFGAINNILLQAIVDDEFRGRVMSIHQLGWGASAIGGLLMGTLAESVNAPFALTLSGLVTAAATGGLSLLAWKGGLTAVQTVAGSAHGGRSGVGSD